MVTSTLESALMLRPVPLPSLLLGATIILLGTAGCATLQPTSTAPRYWPSPPDPPRIEYRDHIDGSRWIQRRDPAFRTRERLGLAGHTLDLLKPYDVAVAPDGRIFLTDMARPGVVFLDPAARAFGQWAAEGDDAVARPVGLEIDAEGLLYVTDASRQRVSVLEDGRLVRVIGGADRLVRPSGIAVDASRDRVYVVDVGAHDVEVFDRRGEHLQTIGGRGTGPGEFNLPTWAAVGPDGSLFVADTMNFRIQRFGPDGAFLDAHGELGLQIGCFNRLKGIDVDSEGRIWAVDASFGAVQILDASWRPLLSFSQFGDQPGDLSLPAGIDVTDDGSIYVTSQLGRAVEVFGLLSEDERRALEQTPR